MSSDGDHDASHTNSPFGYDFGDAETLAQRFDAPERDAWQKPGEVIAFLDLPDDATVAEIGSGTGYFSIRLAEHLTRGRVIGLDAEPAMVAYLQQRAEVLGLTNLEVRLVEPGKRIELPGKLDLLLCVDTYHHIHDRVPYLSSYRDHLDSGGRLVVIDRTMEAPIGPPAQHRIAPETVQRELRAAGFVPVGSEDFLPYQYLLVFGIP